MRRFYFITLTAFSLACGACQDATVKQGAAHGAAAANMPKEAATSTLGITGTDLLTKMVSRYYDLKNALVASKAVNADSASRQLAVMAGVFQRFLDTDSTQGAELKPYCDTILTESRAITSITDESCEHQRLAFGALSGALYGLVKKAGLKHSGMYREYCPMAFNEKGAYWLSDMPEIKNPYFGKKMLECGEVTDTL